MNSLSVSVARLERQSLFSRKGGDQGIRFTFMTFHALSWNVEGDEMIAP
jgi:hypothetical protein